MKSLCKNPQGLPDVSRTRSKRVQIKSKLLKNLQKKPELVKFAEEFSVIEMQSQPSMP